MENETRSITVIYGENELSVTMSQMQFVDFDNWVRRRFSFSVSDIVIYCNSKGEEIIPGILHECVIVSRLEKDKNDSIFDIIVASSAWNAFVNAIPAVLIFLFAAALSPQWVYVSEYMLVVQKTIPLNDMTGPWLEKAYVGFLSWSVTYLFLRRFLNPETSSTAVKKYSADAVFGGLATAGAVFIKAAVLK